MDETGNDSNPFKQEYAEWRARKDRSYSLLKTGVENKELARELEQFCEAHGGVATYTEYLHLGQFGNQGYHARHEVHGKTEVRKLWGTPLAQFYNEGGYSQLIEFGCGDGSLGLEILRQEAVRGTQINWTGVEINKALREGVTRNLIQEGFARRGLFRTRGPNVVGSIRDIPKRQKSLVVFPYSLDSVPPEIFTLRYTDSRRGWADSILGVTVKEDKLEEVYLTPKQLRMRGISFENGRYTDAGGNQYDLRSWVLNKQGQRAYIPLGGYGILANLATMVADGSSFIIIDEFARLPRGQWLEREHLCVPKNLKGNRDIEPETAYREAGQSLHYYPSYFPTMKDVLASLGFDTIVVDIEEKLAKNIMGEEWREWQRGPGTHLCYGVIAENKKDTQRRGVISVSMPKSISPY